MVAVPLSERRTAEVPQAADAVPHAKALALLPLQAVQRFDVCVPDERGLRPSLREPGAGVASGRSERVQCPLMQTPELLQTRQRRKGGVTPDSPRRGELREGPDVASAVWKRGLRELHQEWHLERTRAAASSGDVERVGCGDSR